MTEWHRFDAYRCRSCREHCINDHRESCTRYRECRSCFAVPILDRGDPIVVLEPSLSWAASAAAQLSTANEGEAPRVLTDGGANAVGSEVPAVRGACPTQQQPECMADQREANERRRVSEGN